MTILPIIPGGNGKVHDLVRPREIIISPVMYYRVSLLLLNNVMVFDSLPRNLHFL